jgi:hypothetical protein
MGIRITWSKKGNTDYKPKKLSVEEKKLQSELYDSITPEVIEELGPNEMLAKVRKDYYGHPDAKGMEDKK